MAGACPISHLEQDGFHDSDFDHLAANAVDFDPVTDFDAVLAHQCEPAEESDDEIFQRDGESGGHQADQGCDLVWWSEDDEYDEHESDELDADGGHDSHLMKAARIF